MQNPFRRGVFPHVVRTLEPYALHIAAGETDVDPERLVLQLIVDEARQRLLSGRMVERLMTGTTSVARSPDLAFGPAPRKAQSVALAAAPSAFRRAVRPTPEHALRNPRFDIAALVRHYSTVPGMIARLERMRRWTS